MESRTTSQIYDSSADVLAKNYVNGFPVPDLRLFIGSMFSWDSAIINEALAYENPYQAANNIRLAIRYQAPNGQLPNDVSTGGRLGRLQSLVHQGNYGSSSPEHHTTSRITQPPLLFDAALEVGKHLPTDERKRFYKDVFPPFKRYADFLLTERTDNDGLIINLHAYETGMDDTPPWAETMYANWENESELVQLATAFCTAAINIGRHALTDCRPSLLHDRLPISDRASNMNVLVNWFQTRRLGKAGYELGAAMADPMITLIKDVGFNAIAAHAFASLQEIAEEIVDPAFTLDTELANKIGKQQRAVHKELWDEKSQSYYSKNARNNQLIPIQTISSILPLMALPPKERQEKLVSDLFSGRKFDARFMAVPLDSVFHRPSYWQGMIWPMIEVAGAKALSACGFVDEQQMIEDAALRRPHPEVKSEFRHPITQVPLGTLGFGPAAGRDIIFIQHLKKQ